MKNLRGYTLIELMIVLSITGILFTIGYNSFQDYSRQQTLLSATRLIQVDLRGAESLALSGSKPAGCTLLNGYQFNIISGTKYEIDASCTNGIIQTKQVTLAGGLVLSAPVPNPILFKSLAQ